MKKDSAVNMSFRLLTGIGVLLVIFGHYGAQHLTFGGLYPYDTYHMPLFFFISGYFFKIQNSSNLPHVFLYIRKKALHLLLPYLAWNLVYGVIAQFLEHNSIYRFSMGSASLNFRSLLLTPFGLGEGYIYNVAGCFLGALFLVQVFNCLFQWLLHKLPAGSDHLLIALYLVLSCAVIVISRQESSSLWQYGIPRNLYLLFWYGFGRFYRCHLENYDARLPFAASLVINVVLTCLMIGLFGNELEIVYLSNFIGPLPYIYIRAALGIWFWLRLVRLLTPILEHSRFLIFLADHSFSFMMHQGLVGLVFNMLLLKSRLLPEFDEGIFCTAIWYTALPDTLKVLYPLWICLVLGSLAYLYDRFAAPFFKEQLHCLTARSFSRL